VDSQRLASVELERYSAVILVGGTYEGISSTGIDRLRRYAEQGGTLIAQGTALTWLRRHKVAAVRLREPERSDKRERLPYASAASVAAEQSISGAIFRTKVDVSHPLCYGLGSSLPVFRDNRIIIEPTADAFSTPVVYDDEPLLSGYVSAENRKLLAGSAAAAVVAVGKGRVILLPDNANFRGFFYGSSRLFSNAVFFGPIIREP
jgi:hypothetical protein